MKLTIGHLYPDLLNLYGDRGNIQCFRKRLNWRGIEAEVIPVLSGDNIDFSKLDIVLLGGGSDREQELVCGYLKEISGLTWKKTELCLPSAAAISCSANITRPIKR